MSNFRKDIGNFATAAVYHPSMAGLVTLAYLEAAAPNVLKNLPIHLITIGS
jgi:hypothetical protein